MDAGIYTRISQDRDGNGLGVARQEALCRQRAEHLGWTIVDVYTDNDTSASTRKPRPEYQRLLADIEAGRIGGLVVYDLDRLHRRPIELEHFIDLADRSRLALASVGGDVDLSTDNGRLFARIKGAVARAEVERKSARYAAAAQQRAMMGIPHLAGRKSFGYQEDGMHAEPVEAEAIRQAAQWLLDGVSLREVARRWNDAGITTTSGHAWDGGLVSQVLRRPRLAGIAVYHRKPLIVDGRPVIGRWDAILDVDTWQALNALLTDPARRWQATARDSGLLLSGVATCGVCGARINSGGHRLKSVDGQLQRRQRYTCTSRYSHVNRFSEPVDAFVRDAIVGRLERGGLTSPSADEEDLGSLRLLAVKLHQQLDGLAQVYADGDIDESQLRVGTERLRKQLDEVERRMVRRSPAAGRLMSEPDVAAAWDGLELSVRRAVLDELCEIKLFPPGAGIRHVTSAHVVIEWR